MASLIHSFTDVYMFEAISWRVATSHNMRADQHQNTGSSGISSTMGRVLVRLIVLVAGKTFDSCASLLLQSNATCCNPIAQLWMRRHAYINVLCSLWDMPQLVADELLSYTDQTSQVCSWSLNNLGKRFLTYFEWTLQDSGRILQNECQFCRYGRTKAWSNPSYIALVCVH